VLACRLLHPYWHEQQASPAQQCQRPLGCQLLLLLLLLLLLVMVQSLAADPKQVPHMLP
jgi:hypothetical protein